VGEPLNVRGEVNVFFNIIKLRSRGLAGIKTGDDAVEVNGYYLKGD
jgi:hypothetical protein